MLKRIFQIIGVIGLISGFSGAKAQEMPGVPSFISEVRAGVFAHSVYNGFLPTIPARWVGLGRIEDLNFEVLFSTPDADFFRWIGSPRPNLGATFNLNGAESIVHLALTWQLPLFDTPLFVEGSFGAAVHNGVLTGATAPLRNMGCRAGFYEAASIGVNLSENVTAMITYEHTSNLDLCAANAGLSNLGVRIGYKF